jgi:hypothetical protein
LACAHTPCDCISTPCNQRPALRHGKPVIASFMESIGRQLPEVYFHRQHGCECFQVPLYFTVDCGLDVVRAHTGYEFPYFVQSESRETPGRRRGEVDFLQGRRRGWLCAVGCHEVCNRSKSLSLTLQLFLELRVTAKLLHGIGHTT